MNWINALLLVVVHIHIVKSKCPAPFPGEHGPCMRTCGQHKICSPGLWCCDTPCGGTVCKIPDLPKEPVYRPVPQQPSHMINQSPIQTGPSFDHVPELPLFNQQQQIISPNYLTDTQLLQNAFPNIGETNGLLQQSTAFQEQQPLFGASPSLKADPLQHLVSSPGIGNFQQDSRLMDFFTQPESHFQNSRHIKTILPRSQQAPQMLQTVPVGEKPLTPLNTRCPPDSPRVKCWHDPCKVTTCPLFREAICVKYQCGECQAKFTIDGVDITHYCHV